jgi:hypothetical protein
MIKTRKKCILSMFSALCGFYLGFKTMKGMIISSNETPPC